MTGAQLLGDMNGLLRDHQYKSVCGPEFVCKSGCKVPMFRMELASEAEARHQATLLVPLLLRYIAETRAQPVAANTEEETLPLPLVAGTPT